MDFDTLTSLRRQHPGWKLLAAEHGVMLAAFLHRCFIAPNERTLSEAELTSKLDDFLFHLRERLGEDAYPKAAKQYLTDWAADERGWLRKYYAQESDEPQYDLTPATEKALQWLVSLQDQQFIGAESRLLTVFQLLQEISEGTETDPAVRINELKKRKAAIDQEIADIEAGRLSLMDDTRLRERFMQMANTAKGLLADFRQVEQNFRDLDRAVREKVASWDGGKGDMLDDIFGEQDAIAHSDQGRSFRVFWDFLMSPSRQEELSELLEKVLALDAIQELSPDKRLRRVHYDWLEAGEVTLRTVARLSEQLRRYLDDQAWLENRRIMALIHDIEQHALALREEPGKRPVMTQNQTKPDIILPMERPLFQPPVKPQVDSSGLQTGDADLDASALFSQFYVDKASLQSRLRRQLQAHDQISLANLLQQDPLQQGLAELVTWLALAADDKRALIDESKACQLEWQDENGKQRRATLPTIIFSR